MEPASLPHAGATVGDSADESVPVAFVSSHAGHGGSERYLAQLLSDLDRGWISTVVCLEDGPLVDGLRAAKLPVEVIATGRRRRDIVASSLRLRRALRSAGSAVVHANGIKAALTAVAATAGTRVPVVWLKHDVSRDGWQARLLARRCARVIGVSSFATAVFRGRERGRVEVLHTQIPRPDVDPAAARGVVLGLFAPEDPQAVVTVVGRIDPFKGHADVFAAAPAVLEAAPATRFLVVGGDDPAHPATAAELRHAVREQGLEQAVRFTGFRPDAAALISGSDIVVLAGGANERRLGVECFPLVGLEALALGTVVVGYAHGGLPEQVGECGVLVPPGDREGLAEALVRLVADPGARDRLARRGRDRFHALYELSTLPWELSERYRLVART